MGLEQGGWIASGRKNLLESKHKFCYDIVQTDE